MGGRRPKALRNGMLASVAGGCLRILTLSSSSITWGPVALG